VDQHDKEDDEAVPMLTMHDKSALGVRLPKGSRRGVVERRREEIERGEREKRERRGASLGSLLVVRLVGCCIYVATICCKLSHTHNTHTPIFVYP